MQKRILAALAILNLGLVMAQAQSTVNFSAAFLQPNVFWSGGPVPDGNEVRIGFFNAGFDISANLYDLNALDSAWNEYGSTNITTLMGVQAGSFTGRASQNSGGALSLFDGQQIYLWIFKTLNDDSPADDYGNVSGYGLFSSGYNHWRFPSSTDPMNNTTSINSSEVTQIFFGGFDGSHLYLSAVPEPSMAAFAMITLGMLLLAVRQKSGKPTK